MRVGESRFFDTGGSYIKYALLCAIGNLVVKGFRQGLAQSMQFIVRSDWRFSTLRGLIKRMYCIIPNRGFLSWY